ncbi:MAG: hypothetical protein J7647_03750 [Cyanobacteria bacterium SBLK]|nr:hypothetical protein [Cyanobacteria bacterium SBLK]
MQRPYRFSDVYVNRSSWYGASAIARRTPKLTKTNRSYLEEGFRIDTELQKAIAIACDE